VISKCYWKCVQSLETNTKRRCEGQQTDVMIVISYMLLSHTTKYLVHTHTSLLVLTVRGLPSSLENAFLPQIEIYMYQLNVLFCQKKSVCVCVCVNLYFQWKIFSTEDGKTQQSKLDMKKQQALDTWVVCDTNL